MLLIKAVALLPILAPFASGRPTNAQRDTNAARLARGLAPLPPRKLYDPSNKSSANNAKRSAPPGGPDDDFTCANDAAPVCCDPSEVNLDAGTVGDASTTGVCGTLAVYQSLTGCPSDTTSLCCAQTNFSGAMGCSICIDSASGCYVPT